MTNSAPRRRGLPIVAVLIGALLVVLFASSINCAAAQAPRRPMVVIDAGHGGDELGAVGGMIIERDSNLDMAVRVRALLVAGGVDIVLTRTTDGRADGLDTTGMNAASATFVDLQARIARTNAVLPDVFISLHSNSFRDPTASGIEVWYDGGRTFSDRSRALAELLRVDVAEALRAAGYDAPVKVRDDAVLVDAAGHVTPLFVLGAERDVSRAELAERRIDRRTLGLAAGAVEYRTDATEAPGVLIELLYVSNAEDAERLRNERHTSTPAPSTPRRSPPVVAGLDGRCCACCRPHRRQPDHLGEPRKRRRRGPLQRRAERRRDAGRVHDHGQQLPHRRRHPRGVARLDVRDHAVRWRVRPGGLADLCHDQRDFVRAGDDHPAVQRIR